MFMGREELSFPSLFLLSFLLFPSLPPASLSLFLIYSLYILMAAPLPPSHGLFPILPLLLL